MSKKDYCQHGTYIGKIGADFMCGPCEDGVTWERFLDWNSTIEWNPVLVTSISKQYQETPERVNFLLNQAVNNTWGEPTFKDALACIAAG